MEGKLMSFDFPSHVVTRYCALAYSRQEGESAENVIICLVELSLGVWRLLVDPAWRALVGLEDQDYVRELLEDLKFRVSDDPNALLEQLSGLSVGPLTTYATGENLEANPQLLNRLRSFVEV